MSLFPLTLLLGLILSLAPLAVMVWTGYILVSLPLRRQERGVAAGQAADRDQGTRGFRDVVADADELGGAATEANRAARRIWAKIAKDRFRAKNPRTWMLRFHAQTAGSSLTAQSSKRTSANVAR